MKKIVLLVVVALLFGCIYQDHLPAKDTSNITISVEPLENQINVPAESNTTNTSKPGMEFTINRKSVFKDSALGKNYTIQEYENSTHLSIQLSPAIPESWCLIESSYTDPEKWCPTDAWYRSDRHRIILNISGKEWIITRLNSTILTLGKEKDYASSVSICDYYTFKFNVSGKRILFEDIEAHGDSLSALFCEQLQNGSCINRFKVYGGETYKIGNEYLHIWTFFPGYTWCDKQIDASVFSELILLDSTYLEFENTNQTALKSIMIPKNSSAYKTLLGE